MKKAVKIIPIVLVVIFLRLIFSYIVNEKVISDYNKNEYDNKLIKLLYVFNINESYIPYYNEGNLFYKNQKYNSAIINYKKALDKRVPKSKVCSVRINLSLAILKTIKKTDSDAYEKLEYAKKNLYNNNCASPTDSSGSSSVAEQLEDEIQNIQNSMSSQSSGSGSDDDPSSGNDGGSGDDYTTIEEEITESGNAAAKEREKENVNQGNNLYTGDVW